MPQKARTAFEKAITPQKGYSVKKGGAHRKATTFRIERIAMAGLKKLGALSKRPLNKLVNEAVREYVARRISQAEIDLTSMLGDLRAYRKSDPDFKRAIADTAKIEAALKDDPVEGKIVTKLSRADKRALGLKS